MIDQISKLKDHVNVSIMKAVQVDESKDALCSLIGRVIFVYGQQSIGGHESF
jgi:ribosomal protein L35AE/L33A